MTLIQQTIAGKSTAELVAFVAKCEERGGANALRDEATGDLYLEVLVELTARDAIDALPAPALICDHCGGTGEWRMQTGGRLNDYWAGRCGYCDGRGWS